MLHFGIGSLRGKFRTFGIGQPPETNHRIAQETEGHSLTGHARGKTVARKFRTCDGRDDGGPRRNEELTHGDLADLPSVFVTAGYTRTTRAGSGCGGLTHSNGSNGMT